MLADFNIVIILNAVNKTAFDQTHKKIKEKSCSQSSIPMNRVRKKGNYNQINDISILAFKQFATLI